MPLKFPGGTFDARMHLSLQAISDIEWWLKNLPYSFNIIGHPPIDETIYTDASLTG